MGESLENVPDRDAEDGETQYRVRWISKVSGETFSMSITTDLTEAERVWHGVSADPVCMEAWIESRDVPAWTRVG